MQVESGSTWTLPSGNKRHYSVTVDENDLTRTGVDVSKLKITQINELLSIRADMLVMVYMRKAEAVTAEFAEDRLKQLIAEYRKVLE